MPISFGAPALPWRVLRVFAAGSAQGASLGWVLETARGAFGLPLPTWSVAFALGLGLLLASIVEGARRPVRATLSVVFLASCALVVGRVIPLAPLWDIEAFVVGTLVTAVVSSLLALVLLAPLLLVGAVARHDSSRPVLAGDRADGLLGLVAGAFGLTVIAFVDLRLADAAGNEHGLPPSAQLVLGIVASIACASGLVIVLASYARGSLREAFVDRVARGEERTYRIDPTSDGAVLVRLAEPADHDYRAAIEVAEVVALSPEERPSMPLRRS